MSDPIPALTRVEWETYGNRKTGIVLSGFSPLDGGPPYYERDSQGRIRYDVAQDGVHPHRNRWGIPEGRLRPIEQT